MSSFAAELTTIRNIAAPRISVVMPVLNQARNLEALLPELVATMMADGLDCHQVILVDGGSRDDTVETARRVLPWVQVVRQVRAGRGSAWATGFAAVTGDIVVMFAADVSADPREIVRFVSALRTGTDVAKGSRFALGGGSKDLTVIRALGTSALNVWVNALFGASYSDACYGYHAFWADLVPVLELPEHDVAGETVWGDGPEIDTVIACRFAAAQVAITEVASVERPRVAGESRLNVFTDGMRVLRTALAERRRTRLAA